jgi:tetratricopeptide (TPR) repeat protein
VKRIIMSIALVAGCGHSEEAKKTETPAQAAEQQPAGGQPQAQAPAAAPAPAAPAPTVAAPPKPKDTTFTVQGQQDPNPDTQQAQRSMKGGNYEQAIQQAKSALGKNERFVPAMIVMAQAYFKLHKYELCASILDTAAQIDDRQGEIYFIRGHLALAKDDKPNALAAFKAAVERDPNHAAAWNDLAAEYIIVHNFDAGAQAAQRAVQISPSFVKARINYGSALRGLKQYDQAVQEYQAALRTDPNNADAYFNLGILYLDAEKVASYDTKTKLEMAVKNLQRYKEVSASRLAKDDPADGFITEAQKSIEREAKKLERQRKQQEREKAKPAPAAAPGQAPAPAPATGGQPPAQGGQPK